jgi:hypothetical protein
MKKIILFIATLFIITSANETKAQVKSEWSNRKEGIILASVDDSSNVTIYQNFTAINLLTLYNEYKEELCADSACAVFSVPTFQGFIEFLRNCVQGIEVRKMRIDTLMFEW